MQISLDGYVTVEYGGTNFNWDDEVKNFSIDNLTNVDSMIPGRSIAQVIKTYWGGVASDPKHEDYEYGKLMIEIPKFIFSKKLNGNAWDNATIINGGHCRRNQTFEKERWKGHDSLWRFFLCVIFNRTRTN